MKKGPRPLISEAGKMIIGITIKISLVIAAATYLVYGATTTVAFLDGLTPPRVTELNVTRFV